MKTIHCLGLLICMCLPLRGWAQVNPLLKTYSGAYHRLNFGEESPNANTEKITFVMDGTWSSSAFPVDDNGVVAKVAVKMSGKWKAAQNTITMTSLNNGTPSEEAYQLEDGLWMGKNTYLMKVFVSNPTFLTKYAGSYHFLFYDEVTPSEFTEIITLKADGKCTKSVPKVDNNGTLTNSATVTQGTWKANDGIIQLTFLQEGVERTTTFKIMDGVFEDPTGSKLRKVVPPVPLGFYLTKYAGTYHMVGVGQSVTSTSDKYVLKADGTGTWSYYTHDQSGNIGKTPTMVNGTWKASEGLIQLFFQLEGGGDHGGDMLTDFKLQDGVFQAEGVVLKKSVTPAK